MKKYHIGLDFGTYQTKVCVFNLETQMHEFFRFEETKTYFVPSCVAWRVNGSLEYGKVRSQDARCYYYFKMAAAEDETFHLETFEDPDQKSKYGRERFEPFSPEFLATVFLTYVLFTVKEKYRPMSQIAAPQSFLSKLFSLGQSVDKGVSFTVKLGIPTEWSHEKNLQRKRKFENILLMAEKLQLKFKTKEAFMDASSEVLKSAIQELFTSYKLSKRDEFERTLNQFGVAVYPETAAGLTFLMKTGQLRPGGYYSTMDIGAGTTDISFFRIVNKDRLRYFASESYMMAANDVYSEYASRTGRRLDLHEIQTHVNHLLRTTKEPHEEALEEALGKVEKSLDRLAYKLFNKRVHFRGNNMERNYDHQPCIVYGGGSKMPRLGNGLIRIFDNGSLSLLVTECTLEKKQIEDFQVISNIEFEDSLWMNDLTLLVVALGLSFIQSDASSGWIDLSDYKRDDSGAAWVPHPVNEGYYIYDVLRSKWA